MPPQIKCQSSQRLQRELERLKQTLSTGYELKVVWLPGHIKHLQNKELAGEVIGNTIYIYESNEENAINTMKHEFMDYIVSSATEATYKKFINLLISLLEEINYQRKEEVVDKLSRLL